MTTTPRSFAPAQPITLSTNGKPLSPLAMGMHTLLGVALLLLLLVAAFSMLAGLVLILTPSLAPASLFGAEPAAARPQGAFMVLLVAESLVGAVVTLLAVLHLYVHIWMIYLGTLPVRHAAQLDDSFWPVLHRFPGYARLRRLYLAALPALKR